MTNTRGGGTGGGTRGTMASHFLSRGPHAVSALPLLDDGNLSPPPQNRSRWIFQTQYLAINYKSLTRFLHWLSARRSMSLKLRICHGNLKFNLTSTCATSVKEVTILLLPQWRLWFRHPPLRRHTTSYLTSGNGPSVCLRWAILLYIYIYIYIYRKIAHHALITLYNSTQLCKYCIL